MTHFEYLAVAFSIVLSLAAVRLLSGLSVAFVPERRHWPHAIWIAFALLEAALIWWNFWSFRDIEWNFFSFLSILVVPALIYLQAAALVPENPGAVQSWRDHFLAARTRFFVALGALFLLTAAMTWLLLDVPLLHPARVVQGSAFGLALSGALSTNKRLHEALPLICLALLLASAAALFLRPGSLVPGP
jgi:hypothetical protein